MGKSAMPQSNDTRPLNYFLRQIFRHGPTILLALSLPLLQACLMPQGNCDDLGRGFHRCTITHDNMQRHYDMLVPASYTGESPVPLVVDSHGFSSPTLGQWFISGMNRLAEEHGFIVVWPAGTGKPPGFNGAGCCDLYQTDVDDVGFILAMVERVQNAGNIDPKRIYATGVSNGGALSHRLGCEASDVFAAIAPVSFSLTEDFPCNPTQAVPVISFHAIEDILVPYDGGTLGGDLPKWMLKLAEKAFGEDSVATQFSPQISSAAASFERWASLNGCVGEAIEVYRKETSYCTRYESCDADVHVEFCTLNGVVSPLGGHIGYRNDDKVPVSELIWEFFEDDYQRRTL